MSEKLVNYDWKNDKLSLNQNELSKLPNYKEVVSKLERIAPWESKKFLDEINTQLSKISQKILNEQWSLQKIWNLVWIDWEKSKKFQIVTDNYSKELQRLFTNYNSNNHFALTELTTNISSLWTNTNLIANFTEKQEKNTSTAWLKIFGWFRTREEQLQNQINNAGAK